MPVELIHWKCERQNKDRCLGRATSHNYNHPLVIKTNHNHKPDPDRGECLHVIEKVKDMAIKADSNPRMIMKKAQEHLSTDAASQMTRHKI